LAVCGATLAVLVVAGSVVGLRTPPAPDQLDFAAASAEFGALDPGAPATPGGEGTTSGSAEPGPDGGRATTSVPSGSAQRPVRVAVFGDSTALMLGMGLGGDDERVQVLGGWAHLGCPIGRGGEIRGSARTG